jgi:hypothetical protein
VSQITDDSNIEYKNIFPQILSKNKKISVNISLDRMPQRRTEVTVKSSAPSYNPNYNLIEKRIIVPALGGYS